MFLTALCEIFFASIIYNVFTLYLYGLVTVTNQLTTPIRLEMVATLQYARIVCFYGLYIPTVTNRQVLRLMYRIHTHIHDIVSGANRISH